MPNRDVSILRSVGVCPIGGMSAFSFLNVSFSRNGEASNNGFSSIFETYRGVYKFLLIFLGETIMRLWFLGMETQKQVQISRECEFRMCFTV